VLPRGVLQAVLDDKLSQERSAVEALKVQAAAARAALEAEQSLVSNLKEEASVSAAANAQLLALEQQVCTCCQCHTTLVRL
jgi:ribosomal protein S26